MSRDRLRVNAFGRFLEIEWTNHQWVAFDKGNEGKRRKARDIVIPASLSSTELIAYLDDLLHERATKSHPEVIELDT